ncbi:MAG: hypothetical protein JSS09_04630, partial [Verrucomicrobia bacterium]|nr:hypothetical protein [Verrucomicrobiota bacterium]
TDIIIDEAMRLTRPLDEGQIKLLKDRSSMGRKYLQKAYIEHYEFLTKKRIINESCFESFALSLRQEETIAKAIEKKILEIRSNRLIESQTSPTLRGDEFFKIFINTPEKIKLAQEFSSKITPLLVNQIEFLIQHEQQLILKNIPTKSPSKYMIKRSVVVTVKDIFYSEQGNHINKLMNECYDNELYHMVLNSNQNLLALCISTALEELVKKEKVFSFILNPDMRYLWIQF